MYTTPVGPAEDSPPTHWISSGLIEYSFADLLPNRTTQSPGDLTTLKAFCLQAGVPYDAIEQLLAVSDISEETAEEALLRLGLKLVTTP